MATTLEKANKAAEQVTKASQDSYTAVVDHTVALQERNVKFWQGMFEAGARETRQQAESNRALAQEFVERAEKQRNALQALVKESLGTYMDLLYAPLAYYKQGLTLVENGADESGFPIPNYDDLNVDEATKALENLTAQELNEVREYEKVNKKRETVLGAIDRKLKPAS